LYLQEFKRCTFLDTKKVNIPLLKVSFSNGSFISRCHEIPSHLQGHQQGPLLHFKDFFSLRSRFSLESEPQVNFLSNSCLKTDVALLVDSSSLIICFV
jgi:hypothetical protein